MQKIIIFPSKRSAEEEEAKMFQTWPISLIDIHSASGISYPPIILLPHFLTRNFSCLSFSGVCMRVCVGRTAGGAELVGEAENGLRSQKLGS